TRSGCSRARKAWAWKAATSGCGGSRTASRCWGARSRSRVRRAGARRSPSRCRRSERASMSRVLLADDHAIVLEGLRALLDGEPDITVAGWTTDGTEVVKLVQQHKPDVVVLDLELTTIKGTAVLAALRDRPAPPKVLVLTAYNDGEALRSALDAGADGLALKTESPQQTLTAIRQVHAGQLVYRSRRSPRSARSTPASWCSRRRRDAGSRAAEPGLPATSRRASARFGRLWRRASPTPRSLNGWDCPTTQSNFTSSISSPSWASR